MAHNFQSLDSISFLDRLSTTFATDMSEDGRISILTDKNIFVYKLMNYMDNEFCDIAFKKNVINLPKSSLREELGDDFGNFCDNTTEVELNRMMQNLDIHTYQDNPAYVDVRPIALKWSSKGLQGKSFCVLAILNNLYGLSIMSEYRDSTDCTEYHCVSNVTKYIVKKASEKWDNETSFYNKTTADEWRKRIQATCPKAFIWSHTIDNTYAILFVAHPQGSITSWKFSRIEVNGFDSKPLQFMGSFKSSLMNISTMYWIKFGRNEGTLCLGNMEGQLSAVRVSNINSERITCLEEKILSAKDIMQKINYISSFEYDSYSFLVTADENFVHIFPILEDGTVLEEVLFNIGNEATTGICHYKDNSLLLLTARNLRKLTLNSKDDRVEIKEENVPLSFDDEVYRACGIVLSKNRIFLGIAACPYHSEDISKHYIPSEFFIYHDASESPLMLIMGVTDKSLAEYWDLFEVLRLLSCKEKQFPFQGIGELNYDKLTLTQLKSLRWISKMSENIYNIVPKITGHQIKPFIMLHQLVTIQLVVNRMKKLLNDIFQGKQLTVFQMRSLDICNMYLKEMVLMKILQKCKVGERFVDDMISVMEMANELEYPDMPLCFWCREKIIGPTCIPTHKDSRCCISLMQIYLTPAFKCSSCDCVAHAEMAKEYDVVTCPYCDVPMYQRYSSKNVSNVLENTDELTRKNMEISLQVDVPEDVCLGSKFDGLQKDFSVEDLEEPVEYLALSDTDDEEDLRYRMDAIREEFFKSSNESQDSSENFQGMQSCVTADNKSKDNQSSEDYSADEEEDEYEDETQNSLISTNS